MLARRSCQTEGVNDRRERLRDARLYLVCDDRPDDFLQAALKGGVDIVQLRCKSASDDAILAAASGSRLASTPASASDPAGTPASASPTSRAVPDQAR